MRRIRITQEIKPGVYQAKDGVCRERFVLDRIALAEARGASVEWDVAKPETYDQLVETLKN